MMDEPEDEKAWQAEDDLRTLVNAKKIMKDRARLKAAKAKAEEQRKALTEAGM